MTSTPSQIAKQSAADLRLVRKTMAGDGRATDEFVDRLAHVPRILQAKNRRLGQPLSVSELEDAIQDGFATVWQRRKTYAGFGTLEAWAFRVMFLEYMNCLRRKKSRREQSPDFSVSEAVGTDSNSLETMANQELVYLALQQLTEVDAEMIRLKHFEGLTFTDVAERIGEPEGTIKTWYYHAVDRLRVILHCQMKEE